MISPPGNTLRRRRIIWAVGSALAVGIFFVRRFGYGTTVPAGQATRLFALGSSTPALSESPEDDRWLLVLPDTRSAASPSRAFDWQALQRIEWAPWSRRAEAPFRPDGSYLWQRGGLRRIGSLAADGWLDRNHVYVRHITDSFSSPPLSIDVRSLRRQLISPRVLSVPSIESDPAERASPSLSTVGSAGFDATEAPSLSAPGADGWPEAPERAMWWGQVGARKFILTNAEHPTDGRPGIYALSDAPAPAALYLMPPGTPLALSRDGRTLFVVRDRALWRLDLRKPLPALLDEIPAPNLPEPPL